MYKRGRKGFRIVSIILAVVTFLAAGAAGYIFASPRIEKSDLKQETSLPALPDESETYFSKFTKKLLEDIEQEDKSFGIKADINKFDISYLGKDGVNNNSITAEGNINFLTKNLDEFSFTADLDVNYNNKDINLALGYVDECFYFELQDIRLKSSISDISQIKDYISNWFFNPENEKGFGIPLDFEALLNILPGLVNIDLGGLTGDGGSFATTEKEYDATTEIVSFEVSNVCIDLFIDKESLALKNVNINSEKKDALNLDVKLGLSSVEKVLSFEDAEYPKHHEKFVEVISYLSWCDNLVDLFNNKKVGLDLNAEVLPLGNETSKICSVNSKFDFDLSGVFDFKNLDIKSIEEIKDKINLENAKFNIGASISGQQDQEYSNLNLSYFDKTGYLTLNEDKDKNAFLHAKCDTDSMIEIVNNIIDLMYELTGKELDLANILNKNDLSKGVNDVANFVTSIDMIKSIKNNDFSPIVDVVNFISHDNNSIKVELSLSKFALGENASITLLINNKDKTKRHVIELSIENLVIDNALINLSLNTRDYSEEKIKYAQKCPEKFDDLAPLKGVVSQIGDILNSKSGKLSLSGKLTSTTNKYDYYELNGETQLSLNDKRLFGSIDFKRSLAKKDQTDYLLDFELCEELENTLYFIYNNKLKGKLNTSTILGIVDIVKPLLGDTSNISIDSFTSLLETSALMSAINNVLESKDYLAFTRPTFVKSIGFTKENVMEIVISKDVFGLDEDFSLNVNFTANTDGTKDFESISFTGLNLGERKLDLSIGLTRYDESLTSKINKQDTSYLDFNSIKLLLQLGINTVDNNYYHLVGAIGVTINGSIFGTVSLGSISTEIHLLVKDGKVKLYLILPNIEYGNNKVRCEFVYEETTDGGLIHIARRVNNSSGSVCYYYRADSSFFLEHVAQYISVSIFNRVLVYKTVSTGGNSKMKYENIFAANGFSYSLNGNVPTWDLKLDLGALLENDSLDVANLTIKGTSIENGVFNNISLNTTIVGLVKIDANFSLKEDSFVSESWPNEIETRYNTIIHCADDLDVVNNKYDVNDGYIVTI